MNIEMLKKEFQEILTHETRAKIFYDHYIEQIDDPRIKERFISIRNDEAAHMKVAEKLIELVS